jgi:serine/threonine protein kinase
VKLGDFGLAVASGRALANTVPDHGQEATDLKREKSNDSKTPMMSPNAAIGAAHAKKRVSIVGLTHSHSRLTECVGTPFYRSPEQEAEGWLID